MENKKKTFYTTSLSPDHINQQRHVFDARRVSDFLGLPLEGEHPLPQPYGDGHIVYVPEQRKKEPWQLLLGDLKGKVPMDDYQIDIAATCPLRAGYYEILYPGCANAHGLSDDEMIDLVHASHPAYKPAPILLSLLLLGLYIDAMPGKTFRNLFGTEGAIRGWCHDHNPALSKNWSDDAYHVIRIMPDKLCMGTSMKSRYSSEMIPACMHLGL